MRGLMDFVPALDRAITVRAIADHVGLPENEALEYLKKWADAGLIDLL